MNPLQYWKGLTEWKSREIAYLDQGHAKNPRYWEAKYRFISDALDTLRTFKQDWMGPLRNLCSPAEKTDSPPSTSRDPSSHTSPVTSAEPDPPSMSPKSTLIGQHPVQATEQRPSTTMVKGDAQFRNPAASRRRARLGSQHSRARVPPSYPEPTYTSDIKFQPTGASRGSKRKRNAGDSGSNTSVSRRRRG